MLKLIQGKSYLWLFWMAIFAYAGVYLSGYIRVAVFIVPVTLLVIISSEIRSGVALDSWWRAKYARSQWQYNVIVACHVFGFLLFSGVAVHYFATH